MRNKPKIETGHGPIYAGTAAGTEENSLLSPTEFYRHLKQVRAGRNGRALKVIEAQLPRSSLKPISSAVEAYRTRMRALTKLSRKLEEARVISRELEKRTGLRLTLSRNFQIVVDLSGR